MGILIQFPQRGTRTPPGSSHPSELRADDERLPSAYQRDLSRAVALLVEHVESSEYDGIALILKPTSPDQKLTFVVGGFYRHRLSEAADAATHLHLVIKQRAREQASQPRPKDVHIDLHSKRDHDGQP